MGTTVFETFIPPAHREVMYIAAADNIGARDLAAAVKEHYPHTEQRWAWADASGISCAQAKALLGWEPKRGWSDYLDEEGRMLKK